MKLFVAVGKLFVVVDPCSGKARGPGRWAYFITGFFAFSQLSFVVGSRLGSSLYAPEFLLIPLFLLERRAIRRYLATLHVSMGQAVGLMLCFAIWTILALLGYLETNQLLATLGSARTILEIILIAFVFSRSRPLPFDILFYLCLGAVIGELVNASAIAPRLNPFDDSPLASANIFALFILVSLPIIYENVAWQVVSLVIAAALVVNAGFRILIFSAVIGVVCSHGFLMLRESAQAAIRQIGLLVAAVVIASAAGFVYVSRIGVNNYKLFRIAFRTVNLLSGNAVASQDGDKIAAIRLAWRDVGVRTVPNGFIMKGADRVGLYMDAPMVHLYDVIGSILALLLVGWILSKAVMFARAQLKQPGVTTDATMAVGLCLVTGLLLLNGRFLYIPYEGWLFGIMLGRWLQTRTRLHQAGTASGLICA